MISFKYKIIPFELDTNYFKESLSQNNFKILEGLRIVECLNEPRNPKRGENNRKLVQSKFDNHKAD